MRTNNRTSPLFQVCGLFCLILPLLTIAAGTLQAQIADSITTEVLRLSPARQYRYFHQQLERYFDSGNQALLDTLTTQAQAVREVYNNGYFVKLAAEYQRLRADHFRSRRGLKKKLHFPLLSKDREDRQKSLSSYQLARKRFAEMGDTLATITTLQHIAYIESLTGDAERGDSTLGEAIALSRDYGDQDALARSFSLLGGLNLHAGNYLRAGESFDSARVIRTILYDTTGVATCLKNIAAVYQAVGQRGEAYRFAVEALHRFKEVADSSAILDVTLNLISSFSDRQPIGQVESWVADVQKLMPPHPPPLMNARYLYGNALLLLNRGDYGDGWLLCEKALKLDFRDPALKTALLNLAGSCGTRAAQFDAARDRYHEALQLARQSNNHYGIVVTLNNLGSLNQRLGRFDVARSYYDSAQVVIRDHPEIGTDLTLSANLFDLYLSAGDTASARQYLQQATTTNEGSNAEAGGYELISSKVRYLAAIGLTDSALSLIDASLDNPELECKPRFDLACLKAEVCRRAGRLDQAFGAINAAKSELASCESGSNTRRLHVLEALWHFDHHDWADASNLLSSLIADIEKSQASLEDLHLKLSYLSQSRYLYEKMALAQFHQYQQTRNANYLDSLLEYAELCKARGLRELVGDQPNSRLNRGESEPSFRVLQQNMPEATGLLYFLLTLDGSIRLLVTHDDVRWELLPTRVEITKRVAEYARLIQESVSNDAKLDSLPAAGDKLGNIVLGGIGNALLDSLSSLYISADGALDLIPSSALRLNGQYLIEKVAVTNLPVLSENSHFSDDSAQFRTPLKIVAVGVSQAGNDLPLLKNAPQEIEWISEARPHDQVSKLIDADATIDRIRALDVNDADIIHLATHTTIDYSSPENSKIWLVAEDGNHAQAVTPADLADSRPLSAKLVVLSACESGGGSFELSEGLIGFVQQFLGRGANEVLATHWEVEDFASAVLMKSFYSNLNSGPALALQRAQIGLINSPRLRLRHPYYWAPFVLVRAPQ